MKKLACVLAAFLMAGSLMFAENDKAFKIIPALGMGGVTEHFTQKYKGDSHSFSQAGFDCIDISCMGVFSNNFVLRGGLSAVSLTTTDLIEGFASDIRNEDKSNGAYFSMGIGAGYAFINTSRLVLALTGNIGFAYTNYGDYKLTYNGITNKIGLTMSDFRYGVDLSAAFRLTDHFGFMAGMQMYGTTGTIKAENRTSFTSAASNTADVTGFSFGGKVGVCWFI